MVKKRTSSEKYKIESLKEVEEKGKGGAGKEEETLIILSFI
jgi:hypothetical protein